jgi:hypothetical protein
MESGHTPALLIGVAELTSVGDLETINLVDASAEKEPFPGHPRLFATPRVTPVNTDCGPALRL